MSVLSVDILDGVCGYEDMCINLNIECSVIELRLKSLLVLKVMRAGLGIRQKISLETTYKDKQMTRLNIIKTSKITLLLSKCDFIVTCHNILVHYPVIILHVYVLIGLSNQRPLSISILLSIVHGNLISLG